MEHARRRRRTSLSRHFGRVTAVQVLSLRIKVLFFTPDVTTASVCRLAITNKNVLCQGPTQSKKNSICPVRSLIRTCRPTFSFSVCVLALSPAAHYFYWRVIARADVLSHTKKCLLSARTLFSLSITVALSVALPFVRRVRSNTRTHKQHTYKMQT